MNICKIFGCYSTVEGKTEMCATHNYEARKKARITVKGVAKKNRIKPVSDKQGDRMQVYHAIKELWIKEFMFCKPHDEIFPGETTDMRFTSEPHHMEGREGNLLFDIRKWLPVCRRCHKYIEDHPQEAYEKGWSLSRLSVTN